MLKLIYYILILLFIIIVLIYIFYINILVRKTSKSFIVDVKGAKSMPNQTFILFWFKFNCHSLEVQKNINSANFFLLFFHFFHMIKKQCHIDTQYTMFRQRAAPNECAKLKSILMRICDLNVFIL